MEPQSTPADGHNPTGEVLTVAEVSKRWRIHPMTIYRAIENGQLKAQRIGRAIRITPEALRAWMGGSN